MIRRRNHSSNHQIDMTTGPLFINIIRFILPLIATNLLQQFYHSADIIIVGLSPELDAVGAVGSTGAFLALIRNIFIGCSVGANIVVARCIGSDDREKTSHAVHTSVCMSLLLGMIGAIIGIVLTRPILIGMGYTENLLKLAVRYSYIYLACMPFLSLTNFLSAILQAQGNTKISLYVLTSTGLLNIVLNLFFVMVVGLSVEGVAIATAIANAISACLLWAYLAKKGDSCKISFRKLHMHREQCIDIARIGFPAGIQSALFSVSNIIVQSSILQVNNALSPPNSVYAPVIKGSSAAQDIETFIFQALAATTVCGSAFTAQNVGANNYRRVRKIFGGWVLISAAIAVAMSVGAMLLRDPLLALYGVKNAQDPLAQIAYSSAITRIWWKWPAFFIYAIMNACAGMIRGLGKSSLSAIISIFTTCVFRVLWIYTAFRYFENLESIFISYPISWLLSVLVFLPLLFALIKKNIVKYDSKNISSAEG